MIVKGEKRSIVSGQLRKVITIADDLTGGNATGILIAKMGFCVHMVPDHDASLEQSIQSADALIWNAASRALFASEARQRVFMMASRAVVAATSRNFSVLVTKRIDSTLRGSVGQEIDGALDALGAEYIAAVVPAFPASGRTVIGGHLYVHGVPVHDTEAGKDPATPVWTADVAALLSTQSKYPIAVISPLDESDQILAGRLKGLLDSGVRIVICDAETDDDIKRLAVLFVHSDKHVLPVDPGPFTASYVEASQKRLRRIAIISGSLMPTAARQMKAAQEALGFKSITLDLDRLCGEDSSAYAHEVLTRADYALNTLIDYPALGFSDQVRIVGITTSRDSSPYNPPAIADRIGDLCAALFERHHFDGLYLSGGDIAAAIMRHLKVTTLHLLHEVLPLCVASKVEGGPHDGLHIVTKGGAVGGDDAIILSVQALLQMPQ